MSATLPQDSARSAATSATSDANRLEEELTRVRPAAPAAVTMARAPRQRPDASAQLQAAALKGNAVELGMAVQHMNIVMRSQPLVVVLAMTMAVLCWRTATAWWVVAWFITAVGGGLAQHCAARRFLRMEATATADRRRGSLRRMSWIYVGVGLVWASSQLLFLDRLGEGREFACWPILTAVVNIFSHRLALIPVLQRAFTHTFYVAVFALFFAAAVALPSTWDHPTLLFAPICLFQFWLTHWMSKDVHLSQKALHSAQYELEARADVAEAAAKEKTKFLAAATHDIRQPVIAMALYAELLESDPSSHEILVPKINRAAASVNALFNSLFDVSSIDSGHVKLRIEPVSLAELLTTLRTDFEPLADARQVNLRMRGRDVMLNSDGARLRRLVGNVLSNAIKYSGPGGKVLIAVRHADGSAVVEVWDQGIGIPASQIDSVFDEFFRADGGRELAPDGMGIGLSLVRRLADALGCTVTISSCEGRGTRVTITLADLVPAPSAHCQEGRIPAAREAEGA